MVESSSELVNLSKNKKIATPNAMSDSMQVFHNMATDETQSEETKQYSQKIILSQQEQNDPMP